MADINFNNFNSETALFLRDHFQAVRRRVNYLLSNRGACVFMEEGEFIDLIGALREAVRNLREPLLREDVRVRDNEALTRGGQNNIMTMFELFRACVTVLCTLADNINEGPQANQMELDAIRLGKAVVERFNTSQPDLFDLFGMPRNRFRGAKNACAMYSQQRQFSVLIKQNWHRFTFPVLHELQNSILSASEQIESMLRHNKIRVQEHLRLGKPILPQEPTFQQLFKRLKNTVHVLCVLIEADDLKQGPALNEDEINVIKEGKKILDEIDKNINKFINEAEGDESSDGEDFFNKKRLVNLGKSSNRCDDAKMSKYLI